MEIGFRCKAVPPVPSYNPLSISFLFLNKDIVLRIK